MLLPDAQSLIKKLGLIKLPEEGGFYRETYRSPHALSDLAPYGGRPRVYATDIYYLVTPEEFSGLHRVKTSIEIFNFYAGDPMRMIQISDDGKLTGVFMGNDLMAGQTPKVIVPPNVWQGTRLVEGGRWALVGCTCIPGFEFEDFEGGDFDSFVKRFPEHALTIRQYTHC